MIDYEQRDLYKINRIRPMVRTKHTYTNQIDCIRRGTEVLFYIEVLMGLLSMPLIARIAEIYANTGCFHMYSNK
jgi:hypothetical protein